MMDDTSKAPLRDNVNGNTPAASSNNDAALVQVQPPKREDLQPRYAQVLSADEGEGNGWYGAMSTSPSLPLSKSHPIPPQPKQRDLLLLPLLLHTSQTNNATLTQSSPSQHPRRRRRQPRRNPLLHSLPEPLQTRKSRLCRPRHKIRPLLPCRRPRTRQDKRAERIPHRDRRPHPDRRGTPTGRHD